MFAGSRKFVLIAVFTVILIVLVNLAWWFYYRETERLLDRQLSRRLTALAAAGATLITPRQLDMLTSGDLEVYLEIASRLNDLQRADSLAEVFIIDENYTYLVTTTIEPDSVYFLADLNAPYIDSLFFDWVRRPIVSRTYRSGDIFLKSAFAPLRDAEGFVTAVLGVEASVDYFDVLSDLQTNLWYATGLSLVGGLFLGVIFLVLQRRISRAEQDIFLHQTHAYLGRMVAVVAHELKNPLMIIRGSAERLAKKSQSPEADYVREEVDRLNQIVSGYLEFARADRPLTAGEQQETFDVAELLANVRRHFEQRYAGEKILWLTPAPATGIMLSGYPRSLRQVLLNLLINGAEACQEASGDIAVGIEAEIEARTVRLCVVDHGPGFDRREIKRAFTPFRTTKLKGSGLGLYLSKKIIEEMSGSIEISSEIGKGTQVTIVLPKETKD